MSDIIFKADFENHKLVTTELLAQLGILEQVEEAYRDEEELTAYTFIADDERSYHLIRIKRDDNFEYYKVVALTTQSSKKGKYSKVEIKRREVEKIISDVGFVNAQQLHAVDLHQYQYLPLRTYLKQNPHQFKKTFIYEKGFDDQYHILRHKNLFSKYHDQISDFERLTTIERYESKALKISYELDEDVFDYDDSQATIQERKFLREFAKDIYNKKNRYTERELFEILKGRDLYIQIVTTVPKEHKDVWSKVSVDDMDIRILEKFRGEYNKQNVPQDKRRKYLSKKQKVRKKRRIEGRNRDLAVREYYQYDQE